MMMMTIHHSGGHALQVGPLGKLGKPPFDCIEKCVKGVKPTNNKQTNKQTEHSFEKQREVRLVLRVTHYSRTCALDKKIVLSTSLSWEHYLKIRASIQCNACSSVALNDGNLLQSQFWSWVKKQSLVHIFPPFDKIHNLLFK